MIREPSTIYMTAGSLICFADDITNTFREDVLCSTLYIQLAAAKQVSRYHHFEQWADIYLKAMATFGLVSSARKFTTYSAVQLPLLNIRTLLEHELSQLVPVTLRDRLVTFLAHYPRQLSNETAMAVRERFIESQALVESASGELNQVVFHVVLADVDNRIHGCVIAVSTRNAVNEAFFNQDFSAAEREGDVHFGYYSADLFEPRYAQFRDTFSRLVSDRREALEIALN